MTMLPIITGEDAAVLRRKTAAAPGVTKEVLKLIRDMHDTTVAADGLGLAAPQVGVSLRVCIARINGRLTPLVNPEISWKSMETDVAEEGCLSLPGTWRNVRRPTVIVLRYIDAKGAAQERRLEAMDARVVQHEVDHLDGILIVDYPDTQNSRGSGLAMGAA